MKPGGQQQQSSAITKSHETKHQEDKLRDIDFLGRHRRRTVDVGYSEVTVCRTWFVSAVL